MRAWVKIYLDNIDDFTDLMRSGEFRVLIHLMKYVNNNNRMYLSSRDRSQIVKALGITRQTLYNYMKKLLLNKIFIKEDSVKYFLNPYFGGYGSDDKLNRNRSEWDELLEVKE